MLLHALLLAASLLSAGAAMAQAVPTATQAVQLSVFAAGAERVTGIAGAKNTDITAGLDISFLPVHGLVPALELRGSYPVMQGNLVSEEDFLAGLRLGKRLGQGFGRVTPYGNLLVGRGQLDYLGLGLQVPGQNVFYTKSHSLIYSPGVGLDLDLTDRFALKLDAQFEHYSVPITTTGHAWAEVGAIGVVYRFDFNGRRKGKTVEGRQ
jgi:hypothetical protein